MAGDDSAAIGRAFGSENRERLLLRYLAGSDSVTPANAWLRIYELLLWIDRTTGLAHCYESDKCQPGRPWYARSLAFHDWVAREFRVAPADLGARVDQLFRSATVDLAERAREERDAAAAEQRAPFAGRGLPVPGEDPELAEIVREVLGPNLAGEPSEEDWQLLTERIHVHIKQENKRKNLLGEGFEDALATLIRHIQTSRSISISNRVLLGEIPGFYPQGDAEKQKRVDLALWSADEQMRVLVTSKWSVRADREEQFRTDFDAYVRVNTGHPFDYVLITNEFDAARLRSACRAVASNAYLFSQVVHVNPAGVLAAYGSKRRGAATELDDLLASGRLTSLEAWLGGILR